MQFQIRCMCVALRLVSVGTEASGNVIMKVKTEEVIPG